MSALCLDQPTMPTTQPVIVDDQPARADAATPRTRTLRFVQHPAYGRTTAPSERAWELDARRALRARPA